MSSTLVHTTLDAESSPIVYHKLKATGDSDDLQVDTDEKGGNRLGSAAGVQQTSLPDAGESPLIANGTYKFTNVKTDGYIAPYLGPDASIPPPPTWTTTSVAGTPNLYTVKALVGGQTGYLFIPEKDTAAPQVLDQTASRCDSVERNCFLHPVTGSSTSFNVVPAGQTSVPPMALCDNKDPDERARFAPLNQSDPSQQWSAASASLPVTPSQDSISPSVVQGIQTVDNVSSSIPLASDGDWPIPLYIQTIYGN